ncbi:MAG: DNA/RNA non-specific endonuclease [Candidatus Omnitrophota bacterium]
MKKLHNFFLYLFIALLLVPGCNVSTKSQPATAQSTGLFAHTKRADNNEHILFGYPGHEKIILYRKGYVLGYNPDKKNADWVSYHFTEAYCVKNAGRTGDFRPDPDLPPGQRAELVDYKNSGYDKGHLAPAADMARDTQTMSESFLLSNMTPQVGIGFNRGIWKNLEEKVRSWVHQKKNIYVFTGPIYANSTYKTIGPNRVAVPAHFYKIIVSCTETGENLDSIAFILPNQKGPGNMLPQFITSIREIEKRTGLDFMHDLDDDIENKLETKTAKMW